MRITFIGHGYVGLVTACVFANLGNDVWVVGHTQEKIEKLKKGIPLIYEPGLEEVLKKNLGAQRLHFTLDYKEGLSGSNIVFIAVGTPPKQNGQADLTAVLNVAKEIGTHLSKGYTVVSCKSTVPVGTNKKVQAIIEETKNEDVLIDMASCPEFLREGTALQDTLSPDRIVIGSDSQKAIETLLELHKPLKGQRIITNLASAELIKYTSNAMLATRLSFANMIALFAEKTGANIEEVLNAVGMDKRIGSRYLYPGAGYGGSCLPKDVKALIHMGHEYDVDMSLLQAVEHINKCMRDEIVSKVLTYKNVRRIAVWGLAFKPDTDDVREAPAFYIVSDLIKRGYSITAYDPEAVSTFRALLPSGIDYAQSTYDAVKDADLLLILTEWNEFKQIDLRKVYGQMAHKNIVDARNIYDPPTMRTLGFSYMSVGRTNT